MKRIIDGVTYNTDTATVIARWEANERDTGGTDQERTLYQTRGGAFFVHARTISDRKDARGEWQEREVNEFDPLTRDEAQRWILEGQVEILNDVFGEPPEASEEVAPGATIYVRVPASLKDRIEAQATGDKLSVNAWAIRCMERCGKSDEVGDRLGEIMQTWASFQSGHTASPASEMLEHMYDQAKFIGELLGWRGKDLENLSSDAALTAASLDNNAHRRWRHPHET